MFNQNILIVKENEQNTDEESLSRHLEDIGYHKTQIIIIAGLPYYIDRTAGYEIILFLTADMDQSTLLVQQLHNDFPTVPIIIITNTIPSVEILPDGADDWLYKSWLEPLLLKKTIQMAFRRRQNMNNYMNIFREAVEIENILESITDGFFTLNKKWEFTYINKSFEIIIKRTREELLGKGIWEAFPNAVDLDFYHQYHKAVKENIPVHFEEFYPDTPCWLRVNAYPTNAGLVVYFMDITDQKEYQQKIERQNRQFKEIAWVQAHQIRGPVSNLMGLVDLLYIDQHTNPDNVELLARIKHTAIQMDESIKEIVYLTQKLES